MTITFLMAGNKHRPGGNNPTNLKKMIRNISNLTGWIMFRTWKLYLVSLLNSLHIEACFI